MLQSLDEFFYPKVISKSSLEMNSGHPQREHSTNHSIWWPWPIWELLVVFQLPRTRCGRSQKKQNRCFQDHRFGEIPENYRLLYWSWLVMTSTKISTIPGHGRKPARPRCWEEKLESSWWMVRFRPFFSF